MRAYPDSAAVLKLVENELRSFEKRVLEYESGTRDRQGEKLADSGIVGTITTHLYSYEMSRLLTRVHKNALAFDWEDEDDDEANGVFELLPILVSWQENDTIDNDEEFLTREWLQLARGRKQRCELETVLGLMDSADLPGDVKRHLWDKFEPPIRWDLTGSSASRTLKRLPGGRIFYQTEPMKSRTRDFRASLSAPGAKLVALNKSQGLKYVQAVNEMLAVRNRELFPVTHANPSEVYTVDPGRGLRIAIFGARMEVRLPLESNFGMLLVRNGLPVGYGIAATLFDRVEIAINVFPAFRAGESSFIIEQVFKTFYHHFGSRVFVVRSTQMGHGEEEALHSGAFWFYFKLGCRAVNQRIRRMADREFARILSTPGYRVPLSRMKRLAKTDVFLHADPDQMESWQEMAVMNIGRAVTSLFAQKFNGDRRRGTDQAVKRAVKVLGIGSFKKWRADEQLALRRLAPLVMCIPGIGRWSRPDKQLLAEIIRAKGGTRERTFVRLSNQHAAFRKALEKLAIR